MAYPESPDSSISPLASLSLTHVFYNPSDPLSLLSAYLALLPQALVIVYATLSLSTREIEVLLMFLGQLTSEAINYVLKRLFKEERPKHIITEHTNKGYGMPSSHAQFVWFWCVALGLVLCVRHRARPSRVSNKNTNSKERGQTQEEEDNQPRGGGSEEGRKNVNLTDLPQIYSSRGIRGVTAHIEAFSHSPWSLPQRVLVTSVAVVVAALVSWSRIYLGYHTPKQVLAGSAVGVVSAVAWFAVTHVMRKTGMLAWLLEFPVSRWLRIRDLLVDEDLCQAGWEKWEEKRRRTRATGLTERGREAKKSKKKD